MRLLPQTKERRFILQDFRNYLSLAKYIETAVLLKTSFSCMFVNYSCQAMLSRKTQKLDHLLKSEGCDNVVDVRSQ